MPRTEHRWYSPATTSGLILSYTIMGTSVAVGYLWSIGHCVFLALFVVALGAQIQQYTSNPVSFPLSTFFIIKAGSVAIALVLLLLIRWRVADFGDATTNQYFEYNSDHVDPPPGFLTDAAFVAMGILLCLNILEAVAAEAVTKRTRTNPLVGIFLVIAFWFQPDTRTVSMTWVTAYTIWNVIFCFMRFGTLAGQVQAAHNVIPFVLAVCFQDGNAWIYWRTFALAAFLAFIDNSMTSWIPDQDPSWKLRWKGPCEENRKQVIQSSVVIVFDLIATACLLATVIHVTRVH